jgi:hypothetical protein
MKVLNKFGFALEKMKQHDDTSEESDNIYDYLENDFSISEIPELDQFFSGYSVYQALNKLLNGAEPKVALKLYILNAFVSSKNRSVWTIQDINSYFHFIRENQRVSILNQLRSARVIELDYNDNLYKLTDLGFKLHSLLLTVMEIHEDDSIGMLTTRALQSNILKKNPEEALKPLLQKLNHTIYKFQEAMRLRSEKLIKKYLTELPEILKYHELATKVVHKILNDAGDEISRELHSLAQQIGDAQASLSQFSIKLERAINQIERQKLNLQDIGIGTGELQQWLKSLDEEQLYQYSNKILRKSVKPLILIDQFIDEAEYELFEMDYSNHEEEETILTKDEKRDLILDDEELMHCEQLVEDINKQSDYLTILKNHSWEEICYRMSMLSILGAEENQETDTIIKKEDLIQNFRKLPYKVVKVDSSLTLSGIWEKEIDCYEKTEIKDLKIKALSKAKILKND